MRQYSGCVNGPLLDRNNLHLEVPRVSLDAIAGDKDGESSASVRTRVVAEREIQTRRFAGEPGIHCNAEMGLRRLKQHAMPGPRGRAAGPFRTRVSPDSTRRTDDCGSGRRRVGSGPQAHPSTRGSILTSCCY